MAIKVGINGFGRIGRLVYRASLERDDIEVVGINDPFLDVEYMAYLMKYDSVHKRYAGDVSVKDGQLVVDGKICAVASEMNPADIPWAACGAEYVVESTGVFLSHTRFSQHRDAAGNELTHGSLVLRAECGRRRQVHLPQALLILIDLATQTGDLLDSARGLGRISQLGLQLGGPGNE